MSEVVVYSRHGCHLCDEAIETVQGALGAHDSLVVVDIDAHPDLRDRYTVRVPVVAVDGVEVAEFTVDPVHLRSLLAPSSG